MKHIIEIENWTPHTLNKLMGCHYRQAARYKASDTQVIGVYAKKTNTPKAQGKRHMTLEVVKAGAGRLADPDAYFKSVLDALVRIGLLRDDSSHWVEWSQPIIRRGKETKTIITLEDIAIHPAHVHHTPRRTAKPMAKS